jgi:hypothetical protein
MIKTKTLLKRVFECSSRCKGDMQVLTVTIDITALPLVNRGLQLYIPRFSQKKTVSSELYKFKLANPYVDNFETNCIMSSLA